jgi:hypothetical protein
MLDAQGTLKSKFEDGKSGKGQGTVSKVLYKNTLMLQS